MSWVAIAASVVLIAFGGIGIDLMHTEVKRNKIQNTLDRAVLAAADLEQIIEPEVVVRDYFEKMSMPDALTDVTVDQGINFKQVSGTASMTMPSNFTELLGVTSLRAEGSATAEERIANVEISMVLDISGSMKDNNKMANLRTAAETFIDTVLVPENDGLVSVSIVPYSEHVNAGPAITGQLNVNWRHGYSYCLEFPDSAFGSTELDTRLTYQQVQHFQWNFFGQNTLRDTICPRYQYEQIQAFSQDPADLKAQINSLQPRAGTSIFLGMKWGAALLDPSTRGIVSALASDGDADAAFVGRPANYNDVNTLKTVVLMTDGQHDRSYRLSDWAYDTQSEVAHWASYNLWYYLQRSVNSYYWNSFYYQKYNATLGDSLLGNICDAAKENGIVIWSIGFEVTDHGADVMKRCASSPAHFYRVEGIEIENAFYSIARAINQLRLTQ
ncbi:pilus assembly protein TadG-related protein [Roseivivax isoporae]|uniref:Putative Flp pilus-assembly TadG-like N-terminal domain-containing protein n=1 Tax=Roseivivax isoporae LMG 25204 TaxID=1449351 RepID=X7F377_9RHOB|nr:pilus assembly protein TadG-related protein [Roseivivax isoporae]ETX27377.1 hypothetical protein RISW2_14370 [Roseivivax isoporae LMG 25204]